VGLYAARGQWDQWAGGSGSVGNEAIWPCSGATKAKYFRRDRAMISFCLSRRAKVILSWLLTQGIRKIFLVLGLIVLSACNIDNENGELDTLPKLCAKLKTKDLETDIDQSFDACRRLNLLNDFNDFNVIFDRYYVEPEDSRYECLGNIKSSDYYSTYNERIGLKYKNVIEAVKRQDCLNTITNYNDVAEKNTVVIDPNFLLSKFRYFPENQSLQYFFEYDGFYSYPIYVVMNKKLKNWRIACLIVYDGRITSKPNEISSDIDCLQRI
jgi:hypothetical protein